MEKNISTHETTARLEASDLAQVAGYAHFLGKKPPTIARLPVDRGLGGLVSGVRWGHDPTTVFLHGGQLNAHTWDGVLLHAGIPALSYDLPGHGHSLRMEAGSYTVAAIADAIADQMERDFSGPVAIVGHSFGGTIATVLAARRPELCNGLILLDSTPHGVGTAGDDPDTLLAGTLDELVDSVHERVPTRRRESLFRGVQLNARQREDGLWEWCWDPAYKADSSVRQEERDAIWTDVENLSVPVMLVRGELSTKSTPSMVEDFCARQPRTLTTVAPGAGHNIHTDAAEWTAHLIVEILASNRAGN